MAGKGEEEEVSQEINKENDTQEQTESEKVERINRLPLTRIKHIIKMDPDVTLASQDAVLMIAKAAVSKVSLGFMARLNISRRNPPT